MREARRPDDRMSFIAVAAAVLASAPSPAASAGFPHFPAGCARTNVAAAGSIVPAELCRARRRTGRAVVVLHGCGGFSTFDHRLATTLPNYGITTLDVDYFALTPPPNKRGFCLRGGNPAQALGTWIRLVDSAGTILRKTRGINSVGIVGWSLGGDVALAAASLRAPRPFAAVAGFSAGPLSAGTGTSRLPPTILLLGGRDDRALLRHIGPFRRALRSAGVPFRIVVYRGGTHDWRRRQGTAGIAQAAAFLLRHLR